MTDKEARRQARRRWGRGAHIRITNWKKTSKDARPLTHAIGRIELGCLFAVKGQGRNWAEAFADAERKAGLEAASDRKIQEARSARVRRRLSDLYGGRS